MLKFKSYINKSYFSFIDSDLSDLDFEKYYRPTYIIHAASNASSQFYGTDPIGTTLPNFLGTYNLLKWSRKLDVKSILFVSSGEVYGVTDKDYIDENDFGVSNPTDIRYCYGESKRMGECLCKIFNYQYDIPVKIARLGHTYGPTMDYLHDKRVFSEFVKNIVERENIVIKSDGKPMRAFCYVADAIDGFFKILINGINGEAYNVTNKNGLISINDLAKLLINIFNDRNLKIEYRKRDCNEEYIESNVKKHNVPDSYKLEQLGWKIKYDIKEGFNRTVIGIEEDNSGMF